MTLREYIESLEALAAEHGDEMEVQTYILGDRVVAPGPRVAYELILRGRQRKPGFWRDGCSDHQGRQGKKVIRV